MNIAIDSHLGQDRVAKKIRAYLDEIIAFRRELHQNPELAFQEKRTSNLVVSYLASFGYQVEHGIAGTGIVASLKKGVAAVSSVFALIWTPCPFTKRQGLPMPAAPRM